MICLCKLPDRERREEKESETGESARDEYLKTRQFEQPGELITLPSGIQYRWLKMEMLPWHATSASMLNIQNGADDLL